MAQNIKEVIKTSLKLNEADGNDDNNMDNAINQNSSNNTVIICDGDINKDDITESDICDLGEAVSSDSIGLPSGGRTFKEFEDHYKTMKKENFDLKLRIYLLQERMGGPFNVESENAVSAEMKTMRAELLEKQDLLCQALKVLEFEEEEHRKDSKSKETELKNVQELYENINKKFKELQEEIKTQDDNRLIPSNQNQLKLQNDIIKELDKKIIYLESQLRNERLKVEKLTSLNADISNLQHALKKKEVVGLEEKNKEQELQCVSNKLIPEKKIEKLEQDQRKLCHLIQTMIETKRQNSKQIEELHNSLQQRDSKIQMLEEKLKTLESKEKKSLKTKVSELNLTAATPASDDEHSPQDNKEDEKVLLNQYRELIDKLDTQKQILYEKLEERDAEILSLHSRYDFIVKELNVKNNRIEEFELLSGKGDSPNNDPKETSELGNEEVNIWLKKTEEKDKEIEKLENELAIRTNDLQTLVNNELWEKNKEIEKIQSIFNENLEKKNLEISALQKDIDNQNIELLKLQEQMKNISDEQTSDLQNHQTELVKSEDMRQMVCAKLNTRLEELAQYLGLLIEKKPILELLECDKKSKFKSFINQTLELSRMSLNPDENLLQSTNISDLLNDDLKIELLFLEEDDRDVSEKIFLNISEVLSEKSDHSCKSVNKYLDISETSEINVCENCTPNPSKKCFSETTMHQIKELKEKLHFKEQELEEERFILKKTLNELQEGKIKIQEGITKHEELQAIIECFEKNAIEASEKLKISVEEISKMNTYVKELEASKVLLTESMEINSKVVQDKLNQLEVEKNEALQDKIELEKKYHNVINDIKSGNAKLHKLKDEMSSIEPRVRYELEKKIHASKMEYEMKINEIQLTAEAKVRRMQDAAIQLQNEYKQEYVNKNEIDRLVLIIQDLQELLQNAECKVQKFELAEINLKQNYQHIEETYQKKVFEIQKELDGATLEHTKLMLENMKMHEERSQMDIEIKQLYQKEEEFEKQVKELKLDIFNLKNTLQKEVDFLEVQKKSLHSKLSELESINAQLMKKMSNMQCSKEINQANSASTSPVSNILDMYYSRIHQYSENSGNFLYEGQVGNNNFIINSKLDQQPIELNRLPSNSLPNLMIVNDHGQFLSLGVNNVVPNTSKFIQNLESVGLHKENTQLFTCYNKLNCSRVTKNTNLKRKLRTTTKLLEDLFKTNEGKKMVEKSVCSQLQGTNQPLNKHTKATPPSSAGPTIKK